MSSLKERLIESMIKDLESIKEIDNNKTLRKECSLLLKRIESAKKLLMADDELTRKVFNLEEQTRKILLEKR